MALQREFILTGYAHRFRRQSHHRSHNIPFGAWQKQFFAVPATTAKLVTYYIYS